MLFRSLDKITHGAYDAYALKVDWKTYDNKPMPTWQELPDNIKQRWYAAIHEAIMLSRHLNIIVEN